MDLAEEDFTSESEDDDPTTEYLLLCQLSDQLLRVIQRHHEKIVDGLVSTHIVSARLLSDITGETQRQQLFGRKSKETVERCDECCTS